MTSGKVDRQKHYMDAAKYVVAILFDLIPAHLPFFCKQKTGSVRHNQGQTIQKMVTATQKPSFPKWMIHKELFSVIYSFCYLLRVITQQRRVNSNVR